MLIEMCKSKIHRATVTQVELYYEGSVAIDEKLLKASNIVPYEKVHILNLNNGNRAETYAIVAPENSGEICLNGPTARLGCVGDEIIILSYGMVSEKELKNYVPKIVHVDKNNKLIKKAR